MIKITRPPKPEFLTDPGNIWEAETKEAIVHYEKGILGSFNFETYRNKKLKDALRAVFKKCAYCDSSYAPTSDGDVEHFRPKGKINEKNPQTPGYYWLANDWDNLFLACQHCNQRRTHLLYGEEEIATYGKLDQFPLETEARRLVGPAGNWKMEESARLLINPCLDEPNEHIGYEKEQGVIVPLTKKGEVSVKVYVLQRPYLVEERKKVLLRLLNQMQHTRDLLQERNLAINRPAMKKIFDDSLAILLNFTVEEAPYAGMCRFFVKQFLQENGLA